MTLDVFLPPALPVTQAEVCASLSLAFLQTLSLSASGTCCSTLLSGRASLPLSPHLGLPLGEVSPDHSLYTRAHDYKCGLWGNSTFPSSRYHCVEIHVSPCDSSRCNVCLHLWNGSPMKAGALAISLMLLYLLCLASFLAYGLCSINIC